MQGPQNNVRASWGEVAKEALKSPLRSGLLDLGLAGANAVGGAVFRDPVLIAGAALFGGIGGSRLKRLVTTMRPPAHTHG